MLSWLSLSLKPGQKRPALPDSNELPASEEMQCAICGRIFAIDDLAWHLSQLICRDCLAELNSCGCSDT